MARIGAGTTPTCELDDDDPDDTDGGHRWTTEYGPVSVSGGGER